MKADDIFGPAERERLQKAISEAELQSSGEIRVHIEDQCKEEVLDHAAFIFNALDMHKTSARNGVLIYMAIIDHKFAIIGDSGINDVVEDNFWESTKNKMKQQFIAGDIIGGLEAGIKEAGERLKKYFPYQSDDIDELSNEISIGNIESE